MQVVLGGLLGLASAVLEPPPKSPPNQDLAAAVEGASHTALCAVARMASYSLPSISTALLAGGAVPLLAGLLGGGHVGIVLRRAALVTLIDLCQVGRCFMGAFPSCCLYLENMDILFPSVRVLHCIFIRFSQTSVRLCGV